MAHKQNKMLQAELKKIAVARMAVKRSEKKQKAQKKLVPDPIKEEDKIEADAHNIELAKRVLARRRLLEFIKQFHPRYKAGWVHADICRRLEKFSADVETAAKAQKQGPRLMLLMPPRHGKSQIASKLFPAWHLGHYSHHEFIGCSYNISLALEFSREVRDVIKTDQYHKLFPNTVLNESIQGAETWKLASPTGVGVGGYVAAGVGGGITGKGAHILVIDDPVKNAEEADSLDIREKIWSWYRSTAYSRLAPGAGVLIIQCMTGDTPVLMADGVERRLDTLGVGDEIATFAKGKLETAAIKNFKSNGHDYVLTITMKSGRMVRANGRHPFLTILNGELKWVRTQNLTTAHKIVILKDNTGNGRVLTVKQMDVQSRLAAVDSVPHTTTRKNGRMATDHQVSTSYLGAQHVSNTDMVSQLVNMTGFSLNKAEYALYAERLPANATSQNTGVVSALTTAMNPAKYEDSSAMTATRELDTLKLSQWHSLEQNTSDFTLDEIVSIEPTGFEEVFDVQVDRTENFIANGLVSHNTCWHDDDLAGRLQKAMEDSKDLDDDDENKFDQFEVIKYPAIAMEDEEFRMKGEPLHPERYNLEALKRIKAVQGPRYWAALYQQDPVPDEGQFFKKEYFVYRNETPQEADMDIYQAWDFAVSDKHIKGNNWTVGITIGLDHEDNAHVLERVRMKTNDYGIVEDEIINMYNRYKRVTSFGGEDGQIWRTMMHSLKRRMRERQVYIPIDDKNPLKAISSKEVRARPLQARMQNRKVTFPRGAAWVDELIKEFLRFPSGTQDDQVDAMAWCVQLLLGKAPPRGPQKPRNRLEKTVEEQLKGLRKGSNGLQNHLLA